MSNENAGMEVELKACPFCGAMPQTNFFKDRIGSVATITCINDECVTRDNICVEKVSMKLAIKAWNTRTPEPAGGLVELNERALALFITDRSFTLSKEHATDFGQLWAKEICAKFGTKPIQTSGEK